jgi:glycosyltransferase involved in cell wall biosynthesis
MIRIAFLAPYLTTGGTQRHLQQVVRLLDRDRFTAEVLTLHAGGEIEAALRADGVPVTSLAVGSRLTGPRAAHAMLQAARRLRAAGVHVMHGYQWRPALVGTIVARLARIPLVLASKRSLTGGDRRARLAWRVIGRRVDTLVVNADALRAESEAHGVAARWAVIPSGVDTDHFTSGSRAREAKVMLGLDPDRPVVGAVGRLEERKGHDHFLHAGSRMLAMANGLRPQLLIVGDGPLRAKLEREAVALGVAESVRFTGGVADVRVPLAAMDVFVLPSHAEGMSNALLEAMAACRPVVATAVGGTSEVVDDARTGVLIRPLDASAMAEAVLGLLTDPQRAARLGEAARQRVVERFSARAMVACLERLYDERLAAQGTQVSA